MELIKISDMKLKITLSKDDMMRYELDCDTMDYDNTETRKAFWSILDYAKHMTGFDAASERVFIQLYPDKCGGCEMYVTKLGLPDTDDAREAEREDSETMELRPLIRPTGERERLGAYRFDDLEELLCVCRQLASVGYSYRSSAYCDDGENYYLVLREKNGSIGTPYSFISEFGTAADAQSLRIYIGEHGRVICEGDAVGVLSRC